MTKPQIVGVAVTDEPLCNGGAPDDAYQLGSYPAPSQPVDLNPAQLAGTAARAAVGAAEADARPFPYAKFVLDEARDGDPYPLIGHLRFSQSEGERLDDGEIQFIVEALEATARRRGADNLRKAERALIAMQVERLIDEGKSHEAAVYEVMQQRGRSRRHIFKAIAEYRKNRDG